MRICTCHCGCKKEFEEISEQSLALLIALSERKIPQDKTICNGCRYDKHRKRRLKTKDIAVRI
ncbi:MAG: hypothetical protein D4R72_04800 [Nitrosopumilales archaeon]|nr:MAG: hypothetical protein D4R72_04800 [Nitrosopumilales archaeon]